MKEHSKKLIDKAIDTIEVAEAILEKNLQKQKNLTQNSIKVYALASILAFLATMM